MADQDKGKFSADIGQDVIEEALRSVQRRKGEGAGGDRPEAPAEAGEVSLDVDASSGAVSDEAASGEVPAEMAGAAEAAAEPPEPTPEQKELASLRAQLEFSQAKGRELMEKVKEEHERVLRATADLDNYRKRAVKEKEEIQKFGIEKLLRDFLPVVDNLERALDHAKSATDFESLVQGIKMTRKQFEDALGKHGVRGFASKGKPFDPRLHEAMQQVETAELPPNHVYQEILRGFTLNDRLVRPALVMVTKAPEKAPEKSPEKPAAEAAAPAAQQGEAGGGEAEKQSNDQDSGTGGGSTAS